MKIITNLLTKLFCVAFGFMLGHFDLLPQIISYFKNLIDLLIG